MIVAKSVSRFARNIVDCIANVRKLANRNHSIGVFFETEHIYTLDNTSEIMLAVLSASAQEESHTKSEMMNISIEQRFSRGSFYPLSFWDMTKMKRVIWRCVITCF